MIEPFLVKHIQLSSPPKIDESVEKPQILLQHPPIIDELQEQQFTRLQRPPIIDELLDPKEEVSPP